MAKIYTKFIIVFSSMHVIYYYLVKLSTSHLIQEPSCFSNSMSVMNENFNHKSSCLNQFPRLTTCTDFTRGFFDTRILSKTNHIPQATLASGSCLIWASKIASLIWSHILSEMKLRIKYKMSISQMLNLHTESNEKIYYP